MRCSSFQGNEDDFCWRLIGHDEDNVHPTVVAIQEALELCKWNSSQDADLDESFWEVPVVLFPQGASALSPSADAITFMMLMNSTNPEFLVGEQVRELYIRKAGVEPMGMGYVICAPGGKAGEVGQAKLIEANETRTHCCLCNVRRILWIFNFYLKREAVPKHRSPRFNPRCTSRQ